MDTVEIKYTRVEYARKFLVSPRSDWMSSVEPYSKTLEDKYLSGTRLRLRIQTDTDTGRRLIKLNKKCESDSHFFRTISRILLSDGEYEALYGLRGDLLKKTRYYHNYLGRVFAVDVFEGELEGLILCETEAESLEDLMMAAPPGYVKDEVTEDDFFAGGNLCRTTRADLQQKLSALD